MARSVKIVVVGAGSITFGENTLAALTSSPGLRGGQLVLVDTNEEALRLVHGLAERLNAEWDAQWTVTSHLDHEAALPNADFVVCSIEVGTREQLWRSDFEIPLRHGVRQPYAENGGPGGLAHAARNIWPILWIVRAMERMCPDAWFINDTNPMIRICDAVTRHSRIRCVGLCHQIYIGYTMAGIALARDLGIEVPPGITGMHFDLAQIPFRGKVKRQVVPLLDIRAAGLNHFSWALSVHHQRTGEDLYPLLRQRFLELPSSFEPLTRRRLEVFGHFPISSDTHVFEYLPWVSDPYTQPWEKYGIHLFHWDLWAAVRQFSIDRLREMAQGLMTVRGLEENDSEGAKEIIEGIVTATRHVHLAANLPNQGQISNLPRGAIVETPVLVDGAGIHPVFVGELPPPIAELCRRELASVQLALDAAVFGDRQKALHALLLDPTIGDIDVAARILDDFLVAYRAYLSQFWD